MKKILAIDDEADFIFFVKKNLERGNFVVEQARDGVVGVVRAVEFQPDLILLDIMMPGIDGFEVLEKLRANPDTAGIPVIFLTGRDDDQARERARELNGADYLIKPVEVQKLRSCIERVLGK